MSEARFDVGPLLDRINHNRELESTHDSRRYVVSHAARVLDVHRRAIYNAKTRGLSVDQADRWAMRAGFHPSEVWPTWWCTPLTYNDAMLFLDDLDLDDIGLEADRLTGDLWTTAPDVDDQFRTMTRGLVFLALVGRELGYEGRDDLIDWWPWLGTREVFADVVDLLYDLDLVAA